MPKINRDGVDIYYEVHGSGPPLLLTHGYSSTSAMWQGQIEALSKHHKLVLWDMRGHGQSDYPDDPAAYSEALTVADMAALLDEVGADERDRRRAFARRLHVAGVLSQPSGTGARAPDHRYRTGLQEGRRRARPGTSAPTTPATASSARALTVLKSASRERSSVTHRDASGLARAARGMLTQRDARVIERLPDIKVPSLVVVGADDTPFLAASDYMAAKIPGAQKVVIPAAGHAVNIDQPQALHRRGAAVPRRPRRQAQLGRPHHEERCSLQHFDDRCRRRISCRPMRKRLPPIGGPYPPPFTATLSNNTPLVFGMDAEDAARALGTPLNYVSGRPGDEIFLAFRNIGGSGLFLHKAPALSAIPQRPAGRLEGRLGP